MTTEIDAEGLALCPFCGEEPTLYETEDDDNSSAPRPHRNQAATALATMREALEEIAHSAETHSHVIVVARAALAKEGK